MLDKVVVTYGQGVPKKSSVRMAAIAVENSAVPVMTLGDYYVNREIMNKLGLRDEDSVKVTIEKAQFNNGLAGGWARAQPRFSCQIWYHPPNTVLGFMMNKFVLHKHTRIDKSLDISGPDGLNLKVDFDDVNPTTVLKTTKKMVKILNDHWQS